jgi:6-phosphofructo-2-kinase
MVGLPARGKSYITKKIHRYLSWQQHNTRIFNVGNRRRIAAGVAKPSDGSPISAPTRTDVPSQAAKVLLNGTKGPDIVVENEPTNLDLNRSATDGDSAEKLDQSAKFFDPKNETAAKLREQVALDTLDELLAYLLQHGGAVGILDATNSTVHRRQLLVDRIKAREPKLGILFIESICHDQNVSHKTPIAHLRITTDSSPQLLEANMRLKLSGPDYRNKDPVKSLEDFKARVKAYESAYEPLGKWEEDNDLQYIQVRRAKTWNLKRGRTDRV